MVQTDTAQLSGECTAWRQILRSYREEFSQDKIRLQQAVGNTLPKDHLKDVEHLQNQFHIQLINIHDLKQAIKVHDRKVNYETETNRGLLNDETLAQHENLFDQYQSLEHTLQELRNEFKGFLERTH
ncbi:MAG: hypothetical protein JWM28_156 [Chitinophagaceae bacterium]|nr:hypothetical protein [Chitinophagaceae bacterium]